ncbi:hypothetical protein GCM10010156_49000 [Planobispora rosea]|uniref:Phage Gp37/Gp68 family protein n=1 Tax=Planobispora rosea TaxID=35762 RepID=A0A8J3S0P8_PLARO|nr:phage Gp37/Gp68 family protein [Planobispora rosea]GGS84573.1 hypothetical protein GCM10010156_49000 [Planobispora rosea]GIH86411.1 hypothetical protein Pro02_48190 [Planobispora rosea]
MTGISKIEWTDVTWNPVRGCSKVSRGCDHCYAEAISTHWNGPGSFDVVRLVPEVLEAPLRWHRPRRVFINSMSDALHEAVPDDFVIQMFATMAAASQHTFQLLTKRHARLRTLLASPDFADAVLQEATGRYGAAVRTPWPLPNLWAGVSVEDQRWADIRIPALLKTPAMVRFLSVEPMLGPVDLSRWLGIEYMESFEGWGEELFASLAGWVGPAAGLHWVIAGGESGPRARPPHPDWFRTLRDQCAASGTAFFFKQFGQWSPDLDGPGRLVGVLPDGTVVEPSPDDFAEGSATMRRCRSKHAAGRELDGRTHDAFPATSGQEPPHAA